jgi:hypothetical protein
MTEQKELRAKSLEIAALILGSSPRPSLDKYLQLAGEIADYINAKPPNTSSKGGGVTIAKTKGL